MFQDPSIGKVKVTYVIKRVTVLNAAEVSKTFSCLPV